MQKESVQFGVAVAFLLAGVGAPFLTQAHVPAQIRTGEVREDVYISADNPPEILTDAQNRSIARAAGSLLYRCRERRAVEDCVLLSHGLKNQDTCLRQVLALEIEDGQRKFYAFSLLYDSAPREARKNAEYQLRLCLGQEF